MLIAEALFYPPPDSSEIKGFIAFTQINPTSVRVDISLSNVPIGYHGIHIYQKPVKLKDNIKINCNILGGHFNGSMSIWNLNKKSGVPHGSFMYNTERHIGDLCNNIISTNGTVEMSFIDRLITLIPGHPNCIIGRSIVIHEDGDDEGMFVSNEYTKEMDEFRIQSKISGNTGNSIACTNIIKIN